ncbi:MAG TPA: glycosyltransferase family 1 protein [Acidobacteriota bacterium]|nr:glycosyltransferase family 1 protein [Acidobacteriota bacterium]
MLNIGVDARTWFFRSGLGRYCRNALSSVIAMRGGIRFVIWLSEKKSVGDFPDFGADIDVRVSRAAFGDLDAELTTFREEINHSSVDVFFSPFSPVPAGITMQSVLTVHDLVAFKHPGLHVESTVRYLKSALPRSLQVAASIVAISRHTASDIESFFPGSKQRTVVIPPGVDQRLFNRGQLNSDSSVLFAHGLQAHSYILYVGNLEARKNLLRAVEAYEMSLLFSKVQFVLAGTPRWGVDDLLQKLQDARLSDRVRVLQYVSDEELPALFRGAFFFVYPSLYEGFGLPVLEAMACGTPVLTSNRSSLPEIASEAAILVDPESVEEIRAGMDRLATDELLRKQLAERGEARSHAYRWEVTGEKILQLLKAHGRARTASIVARVRRSEL